MFHKEFYPTPRHVFDMMGIDCHDKVVFEPSAGKGDMISYLFEDGAKKVYYAELHEDLSAICANKGGIQLGFDIMDIKELPQDIQLVVMNPPFHDGFDHIKHIWDMLPEGCELVSLCNYETIEHTRRYTARWVKLNAYSVTELGSCFADSERFTDVNIGLIKMVKPITDAESFDFSGYFLDEEDAQENALRPYNYVRDIVNRHIGAVKQFSKVRKALDELNALCLDMPDISCYFGHTGNTFTTEAQFLIEHRKASWNALFKEFKLGKFLTNRVRAKFDAFIRDRESFPFTMKEVYYVMDVIIQTSAENMKLALKEAIDNFTKHTHQNRYGVEGWKTNEGHMLNTTFIANDLVTYDPQNDCYDSGWDYNGKTNKVDELLKIICHLEGLNYYDIPKLKDIARATSEDAGRKWHDFHPIFKTKMYKKGTVHFRFKDTKVWERLNTEYAKFYEFQLKF